MYQFPYTNFHDLDLDWVIDTARKAAETSGSSKNEINQFIQAFNPGDPEAEPPIPAGESFTELAHAAGDYVSSGLSELITQTNTAKSEATAAAQRAKNAAEAAEDAIAAIAPEYDPDQTYAQGDYCFYENKLYEATDTTTGAFDQSKWTETTVDQVLKNTTAYVNGVVDKTNNIMIYNKLTSGTVKSGMTFTYDNHNVLTITGTCTGNPGLINLYEDYLGPGTYYVRGVNVDTNVSNIRYQVYDTTSSPSVVLIQTRKNDGSFVIENENTKVLIRLYISNGAVTNDVIAPTLAKGEYTTLPPYTATDFVARDFINTELPNNYVVKSLLSTDIDLNDLKDAGLYEMAHPNTHYTNLPDTWPDGTTFPSCNKCLIVVSGSSTAMVSQLLFARVNTNKIAVFNRHYTASASTPWSAWGVVSYYLPAAEEPEDTVISTYNDYYSQSTAENKGIVINVMSYNVANYNNDTATYINDAKRVNIKKLLYDAKPDFIGLQESGPYIDGSSQDGTGTKPAKDYLYRPIFTKYVGSGGPVIASKISGSNTGSVYYTNGRVITYGVFMVGTSKLLLVDTHPIAAAVAGEDPTLPEYIAARNIQYEELLKWCNKVDGYMLPSTYGGVADTEAPVHDYTVICMDSNAVTPTDRANLLTHCATYNYSLANGGSIGWIDTARAYGPIDNILCSEGVVINSIKVYSSWKDKLYSDHWPVLVSVTIPQT